MKNSGIESINHIISNKLTYVPIISAERFIHAYFTVAVKP